MLTVSKSTTTPSSSASAMARSPASGVRRSWLTQATSSRRLASSARSRVRGLGELLVRRGQLVGEGGELGGQAGLGRLVVADAADVADRAEQDPAGRGDPVADQQRDGETRQARDDHDGQDDVPVVGEIIIL